MTEDLSPEVRAFAEEHGLLQYIEEAVILARGSFSRIKFNRITREESDGEEYIVLDVNIPLPIIEATDSFFRYCEAWGQATPWPQRDQIMLRHHTIE